MAGQLPRPWFRLGSITRPAPPSAAAPPEPRPAAVRPPIIRQFAPREPSEATTPPKPKPNPDANKSPPSSIPSLPRPIASSRSLPPSPAPAMKPATPSPSPDHKQPRGSLHSSPPATTSRMKSSPKPSPTNKNSPVPSPRIAADPPAVPSPKHSPKPRTTASPPSPLVLPPPQLQLASEPKDTDIPQEVQRKTVVVQKTVDKPAISDHFGSYHAHKRSVNGNGQNGKQEVRKDGDQGKERGARSKKVSGTFDEETSLRVITMAGENRGAFMEVCYSDKKNSDQIGGNNHDTENESELNNPKDKNQKSNGVHHSLPVKAFFNSNVQGINNSILLDSAFTHHDPGIHLVFSRQPSDAGDGDEERQS